MQLEPVIGDDAIIVLEFLALHPYPVRFCPVATAMSELQIADVGRMAALADWNDVVNGWRQRVGVFVREVHWIPADAADGLGFKNLLSGRFKCSSVTGEAVRPCGRWHFKDPSSGFWKVGITKPPPW